jgi:hypothetical protein
LDQEKSGNPAREGWLWCSIKEKAGNGIAWRSPKRERKKIMQEEEEAPFQGDQIGRTFAYWMIVYFWAVEHNTRVQIFGLIFPTGEVVNRF